MLLKAIHTIIIESIGRGGPIAEGYKVLLATYSF